LQPFIYMNGMASLYEWKILMEEVKQHIINQYGKSNVHCAPRYWQKYNAKAILTIASCSETSVIFLGFCIWFVCLFVFLSFLNTWILKKKKKQISNIFIFLHAIYNEIISEHWIYSDLFSDGTPSTAIGDIYIPDPSVGSRLKVKFASGKFLDFQ
jgi:hypothetical protein